MSERSELAQPVSVREAFAGKHVLLTGASGFVGKVWLTQLLMHVPEVGRLYVLLRRKALLSARERFEKMLNTSPAFRPLHERFGAQLSQYLSERIEVVEGEVTEPRLGLGASVVERLRRELDLVVHCAGLVDFDPDLRKALAANVEGTLHAAELTASCKRAALLHVSTSYVAGHRYGHVAERLVPEQGPLGPLDAEAELLRANADADRICREHASESALAESSLAAERSVRGNGARDTRERRVSVEARRLSRERLRKALCDEGMSRAARLGFPNTYTYTKALAEALLATRYPELPLSIVRPSIVESALSEPFPGWNESFNGSAPLAYVMGTWFRAIPAKPDAPFDVIPVDQVGRALGIVGALLLERRAARVYHVGTSDKNRCSVGRAAELIVLAHRQHYRKPERSRFERLVKSRWDAVLVEPDDPMCVANNRALVQSAIEAIDLLPRGIVRKLSRFRERVVDVDERLAAIEKLVKLYLPFMYEGYYVFESRAIDEAPALEPEWRYAPEQIDWRRYWLDVHVPGLRRWAFPLIEGKRPERYKPTVPVRMQHRDETTGEITRPGCEGEDLSLPAAAEA